MSDLLDKLNHELEQGGGEGEGQAVGIRRQEESGSAGRPRPSGPTSGEHRHGSGYDGLAQAGSDRDRAPDVPALASVELSSTT